MSRREVDCGKRFEREIAHLLGVKRIIRRDYSESAPDLVTEHLIGECKYRRSIAVCRWLEQAEGYAKGTGKVAVVFCRERGDTRPIAILRLEDFLELILEVKDR